jgi:hypothetical protein
MGARARAKKCNIATRWRAQDYVKRAVPFIIAKSDDLRRSDLNHTQKKLYSLILDVFSFSANAVNKLDKQTKANMIPLLEEIEDHLKQLGKIDPNP